MKKIACKQTGFLLLKGGGIVSGIELQALVSVLFAAILVGFMVHELTHILLISEPSRLTVHFGTGQPLAVTTCCLQADEAANEEIAYASQFIAMAAWLLINRNLFMKNN